MNIPNIAVTVSYHKKCTGTKLSIFVFKFLLPLKKNLTDLKILIKYCLTSSSSYTRIKKKKLDSDDPNLHRIKNSILVVNSTPGQDFLLYRKIIFLKNVFKESLRIL